MFDAVLIANRGEIAVRVARACRELGIRSVAVYSEADRDALHVRAADEARLLGPASPAASYLSIPRLLDVARDSGVDAIHPGYGFLAENAEFSREVARAGLCFVGPGPEAIASMGDKLSARAVAQAAGVPVVPGTRESVDDPDPALAFADEHGYPVAVKAVFGGGGRGLKVVHDPAAMREALAAARRESEAAFGRAECYVERFLVRPRHIEVQVLADLDGTTIHLGDRDCSLQRRHQKLVEEAPAPDLTDGVRAALAEAAVEVAREMGYTNAGTCEFLLDTAGGTREPAFYFLEMNTRLQVEHPVTELVTGIDLVQAQLRIAAGDGLGIAQRDVTIRGHAIEVRVNAEDPGAGFVPSPGPVHRLAGPSGPWVRLDAGVESGGEVPREYDSLIAKLIVWADTRHGARARMSRALDELHVDGVPTTIPFHRIAMQHPRFAAAEHTTESVEQDWDLSGIPAQPDAGSAAPSSSPRHLVVEVAGRRFEIAVYDGAERSAEHSGRRLAGESRRRRSSAPGAATSGGGASPHELSAPMQGTVVAYAVELDATVSVGDPVVVLEAMKMENTVVAHRDGVVTAITATAGDVVEAGASLATIGDSGARPGP